MKTNIPNLVLIFSIVGCIALIVFFILRKPQTQSDLFSPPSAENKLADTQPTQPPSPAYQYCRDAQGLTGQFCSAGLACSENKCGTWKCNRFNGSCDFNENDTSGNPNKDDECGNCEDLCTAIGSVDKCYIVNPLDDPAKSKCTKNTDTSATCPNGATCQITYDSNNKRTVSCTNCPRTANFDASGAPIEWHQPNGDSCRICAKNKTGVLPPVLRNALPRSSNYVDTDIDCCDGYVAFYPNNPWNSAPWEYHRVNDQDPDKYVFGIRCAIDQNEEHHSDKLYDP